VEHLAEGREWTILNQKEQAMPDLAREQRRVALLLQQTGAANCQPPTNIDPSGTPRAGILIDGHTVEAANDRRAIEHRSPITAAALQALADAFGARQRFWVEGSSVSPSSSEIVEAHFRLARVRSSGSVIRSSNDVTLVDRLQSLKAVQLDTLLLCSRNPISASILLRFVIEKETQVVIVAPADQLPPAVRDILGFRGMVRLLDLRQF